MKKSNSILPQVETVKTPYDELQILAGGADSTFFVVLKRAARRYIENLKNQSYLLREEDPHFAIKHTRYTEQGVGIGLLIKVVEGAKARLEEFEKSQG